MRLIPQSIAHERVDAVAGGAETPQLDVFAVGNLLGVAISPFDGHVAIGVGIDEHVEGAVAAELGQKGDGRGDLAKNGGDFRLDLGFRLVGVGRMYGRRVVFVGRRIFRFRLRRRNLDLHRQSYRSSISGAVRRIATVPRVHPCPCP